MEHSVRITGCSIMDPTKRLSKTHSTLTLAFFDVIANGIELRGCIFARTKNLGLTCFPPRIDEPGVKRRSVAITDDSLREAITHAVQKAYQALGGVDGDWLKHEDEERRAAVRDMFAKPGDPRSGLAADLATKPDRLEDA